MKVLTNFFTTLPQTLTFYGGGLYIGNFYPGPPVNPTSSDLLGNKNTGKAKDYKSYADGAGDKSFAWGIVVAPQDYFSETINSFYGNLTYVSDYPNSEYDGYHNSLEDSLYYNTMKNNFRLGGYKDWYVPSIDELGFILKSIPIGYYLPNAFNSFDRSVYRSSTISSNKNLEKPRRFFYGQSFDKTKYGETVLFAANSKNVKTRLIRKIPLVNVN